MSGTWSLWAAGSQLTTLNVRLAPTLALSRAQSLTVNPHTGVATATGDARYNPAPVRLQIYLDEADADAALAAYRTLRGHLAAADELRYDDGSTYVRRTGIAQALEPDMSQMGTGYIAAVLVWLPTEPYWRNASDEAVMMP